MKKIGFVDFYLSEWHANNYPKWIAQANEVLGTDYQVAYAWAELDVSPRDGVTTVQWCEKYGATPCATLRELCEKSDVILVLAPSDPDKHLPYAKQVLPFGKPTYIDKTFAPDTATAREIFSLAQKYGTPLFSSSALRYATELDEIAGSRRLAVTGSGHSAEEYIVHQAEMVVKTLQTGAKKVRAMQMGLLSVFEVAYDDDRAATMTFSPNALPFTLLAEGGEKPRWRQVKSDFFAALLQDILRFYETATVSFDLAQTVEVMAMREAALTAYNTPGEWVALS
ncbi:MAG: hypothetical protein E7585_06965 [Ruminococcaceae bacterium]|nr:hypothetical protein [Oscillospiraceae bacterium]